MSPLWSGGLYCIYNNTSVYTNKVTNFEIQKNIYIFIEKTKYLNKNLLRKLDFKDKSLDTVMLTNIFV